MWADKEKNLHQLSGLVLDVGTYALRKVFEKQYLNICELDKYLRCNLGHINTFKKKGILQRKHIEVLFPSQEEIPKLEEMDITLLYTLLRYVCNIEEPKNGWDSAVPNSDITTSADILRLKNMRHDLFRYRHRKDLTEEVFFRNWKLTFDAILRLGNDLNQTDSSYIMKQVAQIVTVAVCEETGERDCRLCTMLFTGFKDDLKENVILLREKYLNDTQRMPKLQNLEEKLNDLHIRNDELLKIENELCSLERANDGQRNRQELILETPKKSPTSKGYEELPDVVRGPMDPAHSDCIRRNIVQLKEDLFCRDILDNIIQEKIFADEDIHIINAATTPKAKNDEFFSTLLKRGPRAFPAFLNALRQNRYFGLVDILEKTLEQIQQSQKASGNESQERMQRPREDVEISRQMTNIGDVGMALLKPSVSTEEEGSTTRSRFDPADPSVSPSQNPLIGNSQLEPQRMMDFHEVERRVSDNLPVGIVYPERKSNDSSLLDDHVKYGILEIQDTSPKEIDDVAQVGDPRKQSESLSSSPQGGRNKQESGSQMHHEDGTEQKRSTETNICTGFSDQRVSLLKSAPSNDNQIEQQRFMGQDKGVVFLMERNADSSDLEINMEPIKYDIARDPPLQEVVARALPCSDIFRPMHFQEQATPLDSVAVKQQGNSIGHAGLQLYLEKEKTVHPQKGADSCRKNKNFQLRKTQRNKNIQPGKPLENPKPVSCQQFPTLKLRLPTEHQLERQHIQTSQLEKKYKDPSEWVQYAQKKIDEATSENKDVEDFQTILCLDASYSMRGRGWADAKRFIEDFIAGVESIRVDHGIMECVALIAFGAKTDIVQNLTTNLQEIQRAFGDIIPDGPTQLYGGLYMALAAQGGYLPVTMNGVKHGPQVVLISDGRATHPQLVAGPDVQEPKDMQEIHTAIMKVVQEIAAKNICINCIPVGNADVSFLKRIASKAKGKTYDQNSGRVLAQRTYNMFNAAYLLQYWEEVYIQHQSAGGTDPILLEDAISKDFPDVNKNSAFQSVFKLPEHEKARVVAIAKDLVEFEFWQGTVPSPSNYLLSERKRYGGIDSGQERISPYVSQVSDVSGDFTVSQENVRGIPEGQFDQRYQHESWRTEDGTLIQKDLDLHSKEAYESKGFWARYADIELQKATSIGGGFVNTVLCIDTSASMRGVEWTQVETFIKEFLSGLEDIRIGHQISCDRVAIVIFGTRTQVLVGLTDNYSLLRQEFGKIKLGGPTPLFGGLMLALACQGAVTRPEIKGIPMHPRIIVITDGKPTVADKVSGPDIFDPESFSEISDEIRVLVEKLHSADVKVHCIPVGDADERILRTITDVSKGKMLSFKDGRHLARRTLHAQEAGPILDQWQVLRTASMLQGEELTLEDFLDGSGCIPGFDGAANIPKEDKEGIRYILEECGGTENRKKRTQEEIMHTEVMGSDLLQLGTRVQNEPVWHHEDEGCQGYGTVVGHIPHQEEIYVEWDTNGKVTKCRYGKMMSYDVSPVEVPRLLDHDQIIAVGCVVIRGRDWMYGDQDGFKGAKGAVIKVSDDGIVLVRWSSGSKGFYRYSQDNKYDLEIT